MLRAKYMTSAKADGRVTRVYGVVTETGQRLLPERLGVSSGDLLDRLA